MANDTPTFRIIALGEMQLKVAKNPEFEDAFSKKRGLIEETWSKALQAENSKLYNGKLFNYIGLETVGGKTIVSGHYIEYKCFFAQMSNPGSDLGIRPVGVSGIVTLNEGGNRYVIFGKRSVDVTEHPGVWELLPSGGIDEECLGTDGTVDFRGKLLDEFTEETFSPKECVKEISAIGLVYDVQNRVYDVCCLMKIEGDREAVGKRLLGSTEYAQSVFVAEGELDVFIAKNSDSIMPTSLALAKAFRGV